MVFKQCLSVAFDHGVCLDEVFAQIRKKRTPSGVLFNDELQITNYVFRVLRTAYYIRTVGVGVLDDPIETRKLKKDGSAVLLVMLFLKRLLRRGQWLFALPLQAS